MGNRWMFLFFPSVDLVFLTLSNFNFLENNLASKANAQVASEKKKKNDNHLPNPSTSVVSPRPRSVEEQIEWEQC